MEKFSWSIRPAEKDKVRAIFGAIVIILTGVVVFWASDDNIVFGLASVALMVFASSKFYFTTYYYADGIGIGEKFLGFQRTRKWHEFKRITKGEKAVSLSPFERPRRLDNYRAWFVPVPDERTKSFIVEMIERANDQSDSENALESVE